MENYKKAELQQEQVMANFNELENQKKSLELNSEAFNTYSENVLSNFQQLSIENKEYESSKYQLEKR